MFVKQYKLLLRKQHAFFNTAKRSYTPFFTCFIQPADSFKIAVIVPKKVAKLASRRNTIKRAYYAALAQELPKLAQQSTYVALHVSHKGSQATQDQIRKQFLQQSFIR